MIDYCDAPIIADTDKQTLTYQIPYYYLGHFSRFIPPNSIRIGSTLLWEGIDPLLETGAFQTPDGQIVVIVLNRNDYDVTFKLQNGSQSVSVTSPHHSIKTLVYTA